MTVLTLREELKLKIALSFYEGELVLLPFTNGDTEEDPAWDLLDHLEDFPNAHYPVFSDYYRYVDWRRLYEEMVSNQPSP